MSSSARHRAARHYVDPAGPRPLGKRWKLTLVSVVGVFVALALYDLISLAGGSGQNDAASRSRTVTPSAGATAKPTAASSAASRPTGSTASGSTSSQSPNSGTYWQLPVASLAAFGPEGTSDGDNPASVSRILGGNADQPWYTQWYTTPEFGGLKPGTGLLLDMGETVALKDVRLLLGGTPGADVQLRVGNSPSANLPVTASAWDAGGTVRLAAPTPAAGRYVLIWFTRLPPDGHGHYQVSVYNVSVDGATTAPA